MATKLLKEGLVAAVVIVGVVGVIVGFGVVVVGVIVGFVVVVVNETGSR